MASEIVAGIDPGKTGGVGIFNLSGKLLFAGPIDFDKPGDLLAVLLKHGVSEILIERAQGAAGDAHQFEYGRSFGRIEAAAMISGAKIYYCAPAWWKARLNVSTDKTNAYWKAVEKWPALEWFAPPGPKGGLAEVHGAAEACLIGSVLLSAKLFGELVKNNTARVKAASRKKSRPKFTWSGD